MKMNSSLDSLLEQGISAKRAGDYNKALSLYEKARSIDPNDNRPYGNIARLFTATGRYESALMYWLIVCEYHIMKHNADDNLAPYLLFPLLKYYSKSMTWNGVSFSDVDMMKVIHNNSLLHFLLVNAETLPFYIGHCVYKCKPSFFAGSTCLSSMCDNLESALLGQKRGPDARQTEHEFMFFNAGYIFVSANIRGTFQSLSSASQYYLSSSYSIVFPEHAVPGVQGNIDFVVRKQLIAEFYPQICGANTAADVNKIVNLYKHFEYPCIWRHGAARMLLMGQKDSAFEYIYSALKCAEKYPGRYYNEYDSDDIGNCLSLLFLEYGLSSNHPNARDLFCLAFMFLSRSIHLLSVS